MRAEAGIIDEASALIVCVGTLLFTVFLLIAGAHKAFRCKARPRAAIKISKSALWYRAGQFMSLQKRSLYSDYGSLVRASGPVAPVISIFSL